MDWGALASTFGLIFVAELGDKTQLAVVTQTCKYRRPWAVFWGASLALTAVTLIGAVGGQLLGQVIPPTVLRIIAALAFVVMGILIGREAARAGHNAIGEACEYLPGYHLSISGQKTPPRRGLEQVSPGCEKILPGGEKDCPPPAAWDWKAFGSTFGLLFVAELGDKTQLAVLSLAGKYKAPWPVFLGGAAALTVVTALGAVGGQGLCRLVPERLLLWISAVAFVVMGTLMGFGLL